MKIFLLTLSSAFLLNLSANSSTNTEILQKDFKVSLEWLEQKPKSYAKDFFILQYLEQENPSIEDAKKAYEMANGTNATVKRVYDKKYKILPAEDLKCYRASIEQLKNENSKCIALGLSLNEATEISKKDLNFFISKLDTYPTLKNDLLIIASDDPFSSLVNSDLNRFFKHFFNLKKETCLFSKKFF